MSKQNKQTGNDQIIADFFKKSLVMIGVIVLIVLFVIYVVNRKDEKQKTQEQTFQAPSELKKQVFKMEEK